MATRVNGLWLHFFVLCAAFATPSGEQPAADTAEPVELRVMAFNIEWGGVNVSFDKVVEAVRRSGADMVAIQEAEGNLERLAGELGWNFNDRNYAISRFPLLEPPGSDGRYVFVEVAPGKVVALASVHLPSDPYGPYAVRDGATHEQVVELEHLTRMYAIEPYLEVLPPLAEAGIPVFMAGDFNAPSHADWTPATVGERPFLHYPVDWPISRAVTRAGFRDAWREAHPDPVASPGLTWWAGRPPLEAYAPDENDPRDRIDFVWFAGPVEVQSSRIVGERGGPEVSIAVAPWPSDHRAVLATFRAQPGDLPEIVTTARRVYRAGDVVEIVFNSPGASRLRVSLGDEAPTSRRILDMLIGGYGWARVDTGTPGSGAYLARMGSHGREDLIWRFWVQPAGAGPEVRVDRDRFGFGEPVVAHWSGGPGYRNDYLAAYATAGSGEGSGAYAWTYIDALPRGSKELGPSTALSQWPLERGSYVVRLMKDDGDEVLAESAEFVVE